MYAKTTVEWDKLFLDITIYRLLISLQVEITVSKHISYKGGRVGMLLVKPQFANLYDNEPMTLQQGDPSIFFVYFC